MKKLLAIAVVFLFFCMIILPSSGIQIENKPINPSIRGNTLYVGGSGPGNYSKIQDAVDNASNYDTVFVYSGIYSHFFPNNPNDYHSCVRINKNINLIGEDKNNTIINGSGRYDALLISVTSNVNVSGFTIQNGGTPGTTKYGRGIMIFYSNNVNIYENIVRDNTIGFFIDQRGENISISNNIINGNKYGISIKNGPIFVNVFKNTISNNNLGIELFRVTSCHINRNFISSNDVGISIESLTENIIEYNQIESNVKGISSYGSIGKVQHNNFINNSNHAFFKNDITIIQFFMGTNIKIYWYNNYWDDWNSNNSRKINGLVILYYIFWLPHFPNFIPISIKIWEFSSNQYDNNPAQKPYDI